MILITTSAVCFSQSYDFRGGNNENVYAEFYSIKTGRVYTTDVFLLNLFDNATLVEGKDTLESAANGFQIRLNFFSYKKNGIQIANIQGDLISVNDSGIIRIKMWDNKLYGYCKVNEVFAFAGSLTVNLKGVKNVPQRKKLLFKDSSRKRMWDNPWLGK